MKSFVLLLSIFTIAAFNVIYCQTISNWPSIKRENKPFTRWWWLGNAVDTEGLQYNLKALQKGGFGGVEITPIYGVKGYEEHFIEYLSPRWMKMLRFTIAEAKRLGIAVDMSTGTGWPFGGPQISIQEAASKAIFKTYTLKEGDSLREPVLLKNLNKDFIPPLQVLMAYCDNGQKINLTHNVNNKGKLTWKAPKGNWRLVAVFNGKTLQEVKRSSPGGEGWVMDHFSRSALQKYLLRFTIAFNNSNTPPPHTFFNDSYEVFGADWSDGVFNEFQKRRGYKLEDYLLQLNEIGNEDTVRRVIADYRQTMSEMLLDNFVKPWTSWAHRMGSITRNQAHGSPGNLIDLYAAVDIPECESFGTTKFDIPGINFDPEWTRSSISPSLFQKFASSAAHITGKKYTSSETFTWLREHFHASLAECKPELDQLFLSGINHVVFHGTPYSPKNSPWPGWQFYASVNFSPYNSIWQNIPAFTKYITRCQSFLQEGQPDNDVLLYWPIEDVWYDQEHPLIYQLSINKIADWLEPSSFYLLANKMIEKGYGVDFITDKYLSESYVKDGLIKTPGAAYKALVIPSCHFMPVATMKIILQLTKEGAKVIFTDHLPKDVPGLNELGHRREIFNELKRKISIPSSSATGHIFYGKGEIIYGSDAENLLSFAKVSREEMVDQKLKFLRMKDDKGFHYFVANQYSETINGWIPLAVNATSAIIFDPYSGSSGIAKIKSEANHSKIYLHIKPGQSLIIKTYTNRKIEGIPYNFYERKGDPVRLKGEWLLSFIKGSPVIKKKFEVDSLKSWTELDDSAKVFEGTGKYDVTFKVPHVKTDEWLLDLGQVNSTASVTVNGHKIGIEWAAPFELNVSKFLKKGKNHLSVEVTNLAANRIAEFDRKGILWKKFYDINVVDLDYKPLDASGWTPLPSGLIGPVQLIPLRKIR